MRGVGEGARGGLAHPAAGAGPALRWPAARYPLDDVAVRAAAAAHVHPATEARRGGVLAGAARRRGARTVLEVTTFRTGASEVAEREDGAACTS